MAMDDMMPLPSQEKEETKISKGGRIFLFELGMETATFPLEELAMNLGHRLNLTL